MMEYVSTSCVFRIQVESDLFMLPDIVVQIWFHQKTTVILNIFCNVDKTVKFTNDATVERNLGLILTLLIKLCS